MPRYMIMQANMASAYKPINAGSGIPGDFVCRLLLKPLIIPVRIYRRLAETVLLAKTSRRFRVDHLLSASWQIMWVI